jgi:subtilisin-like proprotein convertase family protein
VYSSGNVAVPIPDNNPTGGTVTINVPDTGSVTDVNVRVRLNHTFDSDIAIGLSHANSGNALSNNNGGSGDNYGSGTNDCSGTKTIFDDQAVTPISSGAPPFAGSFMPQSGLTIHNGSPAAGAWTLTVVDSVSLDSGTIGCFELEITRSTTSTGASCSFPVTVSIPFDGCCVDDYSHDTFRSVVAGVQPGSSLYGYWEYHVVATGETFTGVANQVSYRPGLSLIMRDNDDPNVAMYAQIDYVRKVCLVQVTDRTTGRTFTLRDRNITNSTCAPQQMRGTQ